MTTQKPKTFSKCIASFQDILKLNICKDLSLGQTLTHFNT